MKTNVVKQGITNRNRSEWPGSGHQKEGGSPENRSRSVSDDGIDDQEHDFLVEASIYNLAFSFQMLAAPDSLNFRLQ